MEQEFNVEIKEVLSRVQKVKAESLDTYQTQTQDFHKISLQPAPGKHSLTAVDGEGNTVSTTFFIE